MNQKYTIFYRRKSIVFDFNVLMRIGAHLSDQLSSMQYLLPFMASIPNTVPVNLHPYITSGAKSNINIKMA